MKTADFKNAPTSPGGAHIESDETSERTPTSTFKSESAFS